MRDNPEGGEFDPADDVRRFCKKNSFVLFCTGKRSREGCDHVHSGRAGGGPVSLKKLKESGRREHCEKDFVS